jgi:hypothetical protein
MGTKYIEISLTTPSPGTYPDDNMAAYTPYSTVGGQDVLPTGGTITTTEYTSMTSISGCFDVTLTGGGTLTGTFHNPTYCPSGQEP